MPVTNSAVWASLLVLFVGACSSDTSPTDGGSNGGDSGTATDATSSVDSGPTSDGGATDASDGGSRDADPGDGSVPDVGSGTGACTGRACLERITNDVEFEAISRPSPHGACQFDREIFFLTPKTRSAPFQDTVFINTSVRRYLLDFVRIDLAETYAKIDVETYFRTFEREDLREYHAGRIRRLTPVQGQPIRYAFEELGSGYFGYGGGSTPEMEIAAVLARLGQSFTLPLGYAPSRYDAIRQAEGFGAVSFDVHLPELCPGEGCTAGNGPCVIVPPNAELCATFVENRSIQLEHAKQTKLTLAAGNHRLVSGTTIPLFAGGFHGPAQTPVVPDGQARVVTQDIGGTTYWSLEQRVLAGSTTIDLEWQIYNPAEPVIVREPFLDDIQVFGTLNESMSYDDVLHITGCTAAGLPLYFAEADLGNGDRLRLEYRYGLPFAGSGPLVPTGADVVLGGVAHRLDAYPNLLYAGVHHNWENQFWLLFSPPVQAFGHDVYGIWIDEPGTTCCPVDGIYTLDASYQTLDTLTSTTYLRAPAWY